MDYLQRSRTSVGPDGGLTHLAGVAYALPDDYSRPHLVGLAPRAERERRLLAQRQPSQPAPLEDPQEGLFVCHDPCTRDPRRPHHPARGVPPPAAGEGPASCSSRWSRAGSGATASSARAGGRRLRRGEREVAAGHAGRRLPRVRPRGRDGADRAAARGGPGPPREPLRRRRHARPFRPRLRRGRGPHGRPGRSRCLPGAATSASTPTPRRGSPARRRRSPARDAYEAGVRRPSSTSTPGDVFQIVLSQRAERPTDASALALYRSLRRINPSPYLFLLELDDLARRLVAGDAGQAGGDARER